jgi:vitamin B12 transporter
LTNKINGTAPGPGFTFTAVNQPGESTRDGVEVSTRLALTPQLTFGAAYTYLDARLADGQRELRRPPHAARADITYVFDNARGKLGFGVVYNGVTDDRTSRVTGFSFGFPVTTPERVLLDDYWLARVTASYKVQPGVEIYGRVENVFNQKYEEIFGYNTPGIAAYAGVRLTFDDIMGTGATRDR